MELLERADGEGPVDAGSGNRSTGLRLANALNSLALLRKRQGHLEEAEPLYTRALELRERALGAAHPETVRLCEPRLAPIQAEFDWAGGSCCTRRIRGCCITPRHPE